jgi:pectate lyase
MKNIGICIFCLVLLFGFNSVWAVPAFPGAEGFGALSVGGRGGQVIKVTNLNDSGPGSLREAIETSGPRVIVFEVSGNIMLQDSLRIRNPYVTIAGQTAPGGGICVQNYGFQISADHVIVRYMRFRLGDNEGVELDSLWVSNGRNIIIDHCSVSWSVDETLSVASSGNNLGDVTIQWCMITESLNCSIHSKGCHGYGSLIRGGWGNGYTLHHNLYAHHRGRSPRPGNYNDHNTDPDGLIFDFRNNVVYNWAGSYAGYNADTDSITRMNFVGNYYKEGPNSTRNDAFREQCTYSSAYFQDNFMNGIGPLDPWSLVRFDGFTPSETDAYKQSVPILVGLVETDDPVTAYERILADAGATLPERDAVDARIITDVINGTGSIIDDEDEVGGWPELLSTEPLTDTDDDGMPDEWELALCLDPDDSIDANGDRNGDGYTNIEEYINWIPLREPMPIRCKADINCDNTVDFNDFLEFAEHYSCYSGTVLYDENCDFNNDDVISIEDFCYIAQDWLIKY